MWRSAVRSTKTTNVFVELARHRVSVSISDVTVMCPRAATAMRRASSRVRFASVHHEHSKIDHSNRDRCRHGDDDGRDDKRPNALNVCHGTEVRVCGVGDRLPLASTDVCAARHSADTAGSGEAKAYSACRGLGPLPMEHCNHARGPVCDKDFPHRAMRRRPPSFARNAEDGSNEDRLYAPHPDHCCHPCCSARQLSTVRRNPPRLIAAEELGS